MTDHTDIVERLEFQGRYGHESEHGMRKRKVDERHEAAAEITRLRAEDEVLRKALESIASMVYDSWTNGAIAGEIAQSAIDATKGTT